MLLSEYCCGYGDLNARHRQMVYDNLFSMWKFKLKFIKDKIIVKHIIKVRNELFRETEEDYKKIFDLLFSCVRAYNIV